MSDNREQILNVLFNNYNQNFNESESLDENFITNAVQKVGTGIKHAAQNAVNDVRNSFAITAKQKAQANARTQALHNKQAAENAGNKVIQQAGKAGKVSYKNVMANWSQTNTNTQLNNALKSNSIKDIITAIEYGLCSINVLGAGGKDNKNAQQQQATDKVQKANNQVDKNMEQNKQDNMNAAANGTTEN